MNRMIREDMYIGVERRVELMLQLEESWSRKNIVISIKKSNWVCPRCEEELKMLSRKD